MNYPLKVWAKIAFHSSRIHDRKQQVTRASVATSSLLRPLRTSKSPLLHGHVSVDQEEEEDKVFSLNEPTEIFPIINPGEARLHPQFRSWTEHLVCMTDAGRSHPQAKKIWKLSMEHHRARWRFNFTPVKKDNFDEDLLWPFSMSVLVVLKWSHLLFFHPILHIVFNFWDLHVFFCLFLDFCAHFP